jgi:signal transduction histidine kinase
MSVSVLMNNGKPLGFQGMIRDITKQKEIENLVIRTIIETQENERINFGKNLHDGLGSRLVTIKNMLHGLSYSHEELKKDPKLTSIYEALNNAIIEMRNICFNILPKSLETMGLCASVKELCLQCNAADNVDCEFNVSEEFPALNMQLEMAIFRIVQEFMSNSVSHGKAEKIMLDFSHEGNKVHLKLKDNGVGFNTNSFPSGIGLRNIRSRVQSYNGELRIESGPGRGTEFNITLPFIESLKKPVVNSFMF